MSLNFKNSDEEGYGLVTITTHFVIAFLVLFLFVLGIYMLSLDYTDPYYYKGPTMHKSIGLFCFFILLFRFSWGLYSPLPKHYFIKNIENYLVHAFHFLFYIFVFSIIISGYLIVTAKGRGLDFFNFFTLPAFFPVIERMEDKAGLVHEVASYLLIAIVSIHAIFYFKRNFINKK